MSPLQGAGRGIVEVDAVGKLKGQTRLFNRERPGRRDTRYSTTTPLHRTNGISINPQRRIFTGDTLHATPYWHAWWTMCYVTRTSARVCIATPSQASRMIPPSKSEQQAQPRNFYRGFIATRRTRYHIISQAQPRNFAWVQLQHRTNQVRTAAVPL